MAFHIQREEGIVPVVSVQLDADQAFGVVAQTPGVTPVNYNRVIVHIVGNPVITGNNVAAKANGIYLVSLEANGTYSINQVGA